MKGCEACEADKVNGKVQLWKEIPQFEFPEVSAVPAVKAKGNVPSWDISQHLRLVPVVRVPEASAVQREDAPVVENKNKTRAAATPPAAVLEIRNFSRRDATVSLEVSGLLLGLCHILSLPKHVDQHLHAYRHCRIRRRMQCAGPHLGLSLCQRIDKPHNRSGIRSSIRDDVAAECVRCPQFPRLSARSGRNARIRRLSCFQPELIKSSPL